LAASVSRGGQFYEAVNIVANSQDAVMLALRAHLSAFQILRRDLARRAQLEACYSSFSEGFDCPDLVAVQDASKSQAGRLSISGETSSYLCGPARR